VSKDIESEIEDVITFMSLAVRARGEKINLREFDEAESIDRYLDAASTDAGIRIPDSPLVRAAFDRVEHGDSGSVLWNDVWTPQHVDGPVNVVTLRRASPGAETNGYRYQLSRVRRVVASQVRGRARRVYPTMYWVRTALVHNDGWYGFGGEDVLSYRAGRWVSCNDTPAYDPKGFATLCMIASLGLAVQLSRVSVWRAVVSFDGNPSVSFSTDPIGVREIFRLRDVPAGRSRRAALRHWVSEHWRRTREASDGAEATKVREHLRGATDFTWNGMRCQIVPSAVDLERVETAKAAR
jgi:hypothetical protein